MQFFLPEKLVLLLSLLFYTVILIYLIKQGKRGKSFYVRPIPGLKIIDEAIGRATEMGRSILYVPGLADMSDISTFASLNILFQVIRKAGNYETSVTVPCRWPMVYTVTSSITRDAYTSIGRPDLFDSEKVFFVTDRQFSYAAAVSGYIARERPATNFFMGHFWAEALILAETGASTGAIQVAGTDAVTQLPFFVTACDYTLMGEEFYAASAYLSKDPTLLATLKGQDLMKLVIGLALIGLSFWQIFAGKNF